MTGILTPPQVKRTERLLTIADVAALPRTLPTGDVTYELDNGRLIVMAPPGHVHSVGHSNLTAHLKVQGEWRGHGIADVEIGVILRRNPDRLVGADAAFICKRSLPIRLSPEGYLETIPELIVEVRSKNDTQPEIDEKVTEYLAAGVVVVWVADPLRKVVTEYRAGRVVREWGPAENLSVPDLIPDFSVVVNTLF